MKRFDIQPHSMKVKDITEILIISRFHLRRFVNMGPRWSLNISLVSLWNTQTTCNPVVSKCYLTLRHAMCVPGSYWRVRSSSFALSFTFWLRSFSFSCSSWAMRDSCADFWDFISRMCRDFTFRSFFNFWSSCLKELKYAYI